MADFLITAPNGKKYKVTGSDAGGALAALKKMLGTQPAAPSDVAERIAGAQATPEALQRAASADQIAMDQMVLSDTPAALAGLTKFNQGIPFVGQYSDELTGLVSPQAMEQQRAVMGAMDRQYPKTSTALQVAGGIVGSVPLAGLAAPAVGAAAPSTVLGQAVAGAGAGAVAGGVEGAVSGFGQEGDRGRNALVGGAVGAGLGGVVGAAAPAVAAGVREIAMTLKGRDVGTIQKVLGVNPGAARVIRDTLAADDFPAAEAALKRAGVDAMLADAGPATAQLLDTAAAAGGQATTVARSAVETRAKAANARLTNVLDVALGKPQGARAGAREIARRTAGIRSTAYQRAYSSPIDYAGDAGRGIEDVLQRVPPRTLQAAVSEANEAMREAGTRNMQIMANIADDGTVSFQEMPNVQQLDELKKALGAVAQNETDAVTGRVSGAGLRAKRLARDLRDAISEAVPSYRTAVKLGGDKIAEDQSLDLGRKLLLSGTTREQVSEAMDGASRDAVAAARQGLRSYIDDTLANVQRTITDPNTDAREAMKVVKDMSSRANKEKIEAILGAGRAKPMLQAIDEAAAHLELRGAIARNSATAARMAGKQAIDEVAEPNALATLMQGRPGEATRKVIQFFTGQTGEAQQRNKQQIYAEIAQALTTVRGAEAQQALASVQKAISGQPVSSAEAARIGRVLATSGAVGAYQSGRQSLASPQGAMP